MAIAGLHNVPVLDSSFIRESQSQVSRRQENGGRRSTRASSLLQMWRELEDEHVVSPSQERASESALLQRNDDLSATDVPDSPTGEHTSVSEDVGANEDECREWEPNETRSSHCEQSSDLGEVERERVRRIFREWMNCSRRERSPNVSRLSNSSREDWLGETDQERVRTIRERVQMTTQQRVSCGDTREEQVSNAGDRIERILDGLVTNQNEGRTEHVRRGIRKLCGRQALLDMLDKAERERKMEIQGLLEHRAVSNFAHRNRIQSLLRGRFLRNNRTVADERPTSVADSELGLLRQRQTVSGLREGFFSRLENPVCGSEDCNDSDVHSVEADADISSNGNDHSQPNDSSGVIAGSSEQSESNNEVTDGHRLSEGRNELQDEALQDLNSQESTARVEDSEDQVSANVVRECQFSVAEASQRRGVNEQVFSGDWRGDSANELSQGRLHSEDGDHDRQEGSEASYGQSPRTSVGGGVQGIRDHTENLGSDLVERANEQESTSPVEYLGEQIFENEGIDWEGPSAAEFHELWDGNLEGISHNQQGNTANQDFSRSEGGEHDLEEASDTQLEDDSGWEEAAQFTIEGPSSLEAMAFGRAETHYYPDHENVYSTELRELVSRRSVSTLLHSGFRENLNQLLQSYVERQNHAADDWELDEMPPPLEHDLEQQHTDQNEGHGDTVDSPLELPSPQMIPGQQLWDQDSHQYDQTPRGMDQNFGMEWDIISDMRIDMARLQQRMNNMQRMLEACMDMQLELQRSIRQEVSAALNRSAASQGESIDSLPMDETNWEYVRKGICCMCCDGAIDSLLYRCGHMCTCSRCANELVQSGRKCPMCQAPVIEVIRAYSIL